LALRRKIITASPHHFAEDDLTAARDAGILSEATRRALVDFLHEREEHALDCGDSAVVRPVALRFDLTHVLWYAGALVVMLSMGIFTTAAFNRLGGVVLTATAVVYATGFIALCHYLWHVHELRTAGGLAATIALAMVPMAIYGIRDMFGLWPGVSEPSTYRTFFSYVGSSWVAMELGTLAAAGVVFYFYPFPFIGFIAALALWFLSMDITEWVRDGHTPYFSLRFDVSFWFGAGLVGTAWLGDLKWRRLGNFVFWLHIVGAASFWGGLTGLEISNDRLGLGYCVVNIGLVLFSVLADRRIYAIFGALGIALYLGHLAYDVFDDALWFSFALSGIGLSTIGLGIFYQLKRRAIEQVMDAWTPAPLRVEREGS
jgi:hypothetical protein